MDLERPFIDSLVRGERFARITHTIVNVSEIDFENKSLSLTAEYRIHLSKTSPNTVMSSPSAPLNKALGLTFLLPDGDVSISGVTVNGISVASLSPHEELANHTNFSLSYLAFPESADTTALGEIFSRLCANRRDLISYEEIVKAHKTASVNSGQSFGILVKIPPSVKATDVVTVTVGMTVSQSVLFRSLFATSQNRYLLTIGEEVWFPVPCGLLLLPSGIPATAKPIEFQRHKVTIKLPQMSMPTFCTGDKLPESVFESSWVNPRTVGIFSGDFSILEERGSYIAYCPPEHELELAGTLTSGLVSEIFQVLGPWFSNPVQLLPQINLVFLPLPSQRDYFVHGNTLIIDSSILHREGMIERKINARIVLAEAIAALWISRSMPAFADPWIPVGIAGMLADRFTEFQFGINESAARWLGKKQRYHAQVERGLEWKPLTMIADVSDPILRVKAPLVMECLRRSIVGDNDMRSAFHELATISGGKKGPVTTEAFFYLLTCNVGQHTEAGSALPKFCEDWVRSTGVPLINIGFSMLEKKKFVISAVQRPLQRISCHDNTALCSPAPTGGGAACSCGTDFVCRKEEPNGGATYMRPPLTWPQSGRRRFWSGPIEISIFRAANYRVTTSIDFIPGPHDNHASIVTVPFVSPRKHEIVLNRQARDDELVHGWLTFLDDRWFLAKIVICQSPLMWINKLQMSRHVVQEFSALEALQHVRGSALVQEALVESLTKPIYCYRVRQEAAKALIHLSVGCGEREALVAVINWLTQNFPEGYDWTTIDLKQYLTFIGVSESLTMAKRSVDRREHRAISELSLSLVRSVERCLTLKPPAYCSWRVNSDFLLSSCVRNAIVACTDSRDKEALGKAVDSRLRSDLYGPPLASTDLMVTEAVLGTAASNWQTVTSLWPFMSKMEFIETLALNTNRRLARTAVRSYLSVTGSSKDNQPDSESAWQVRFKWIEVLTDQVIRDNSNLQLMSWVVDCWDLVLERYRRETLKSPLSMLVQRADMCHRLWKYLTVKCPQLPISCRASVINCVHSVYLQAYGTGIPVALRDDADKPREDGKGPLTFWLPFKEHDRLYTKLQSRGVTIRLVPPSTYGSAPKKPRILITGAGTVPLGSANP